MSNSSVFNELHGVDYGVWCNVTDGIDPVQWASLCRWLGRLPIGEFDHVLYRLRRDRLRAGARRLAKAIMGTPDPDDDSPPVISLGPSGLGGQYQVELRARSLQQTDRHRIPRQ